MTIIKKEFLEFSEKEIEAINLVFEICLGLTKESTDPELIKLAETVYNNLTELWRWEE